MKGKLSERVPGNALDTKSTAHHLSWPHWPPFPPTSNGFRAQTGQREDGRPGGHPSQWGNTWPREEANLTGFWARCSALFIDGQWFTKVRALWGPLEIFGKPLLQQLLSAKRNCGALKSGSWKVSTAETYQRSSPRHSPCQQRNVSLFGRCLPRSRMFPQRFLGNPSSHVVVLSQVELRWMT